ncbi:unnamed protein product [Ectocarpus sp. 4 AP-2014]
MLSIKFLRRAPSQLPNYYCNSLAYVASASARGVARSSMCRILPDRQRVGALFQVTSGRSVICLFWAPAKSFVLHGQKRLLRSPRNCFPLDCRSSHTTQP